MARLPPWRKLFDSVEKPRKSPLLQSQHGLYYTLPFNSNLRRFHIRSIQNREGFICRIRSCWWFNPTDTQWRQVCLLRIRLWCLLFWPVFQCSNEGETKKVCINTRKIYMQDSTQSDGRCGATPKGTSVVAHSQSSVGRSLVFGLWISVAAKRQSTQCYPSYCSIGFWKCDSGCTEGRL